MSKAEEQSDLCDGNSDIGSSGHDSNGGDSGVSDSGGDLESAGAVVCPPTNEPAVRLFILAAMLIGFGVWCLTDMRPPPEAWDASHVNEVAAYLLNNWGPVVFLPSGIIPLVLGIVFLRRRLTADESGIGYAGKSKIPWGSISQLNATLLESKGIITLHHDEGKMTLDGWKLRNFRDLVAYVEKKIPKEKQKI